MASTGCVGRGLRALAQLAASAVSGLLSVQPPCVSPPRISEPASHAPPVWVDTGALAPEASTRGTGPWTTTSAGRRAEEATSTVGQAGFLPSGGPPRPASSLPLYNPVPLTPSTRLMPSLPLLSVSLAVCFLGVYCRGSRSDVPPWYQGGATAVQIQWLVCVQASGVWWSLDPVTRETGSLPSSDACFFLLLGLLLALVWTGLRTGPSRAQQPAPVPGAAHAVSAADAC